MRLQGKVALVTGAAGGIGHAITELSCREGATVIGKVLVIGSNAPVLRFQDGRSVATGNYLNEPVVPMQALRAAGHELVVATPDGRKPPRDKRSVGASHFGDDEVAFRAALGLFDYDPSFQTVETLPSIIADGLDRFAGFYVPGGHAPITDSRQIRNWALSSGMLMSSPSPRRCSAMDPSPSFRP